MYTFEQLMQPIWDTDLIVDEELTMIQEKDGDTAKAPLLFEPEAILSVTSADKTKEYKKGVDYTLCGNMICLTANTGAFYFTQDEMIFDEAKPGKCFPTRDGRYSLFSEGHFFHDRQLAVTYTKKSGTLSWQPEYAGSSVPKTIAKLQNKEPVKIVLYGDSISAGANSSGLMLTTPFLPTFGGTSGRAASQTLRGSCGSDQHCRGRYGHRMGHSKCLGAGCRLQAGSVHHCLWHERRR